MAYTMEWENKGVYWKYSGIVTGKEIVEGSTAIYGDSRFDSLAYKLVDFLDVQNVEMDKTEVALIAYQHQAAERSNPYIKNAIVIKSDNTLANKFAEFFMILNQRMNGFQENHFHHLKKVIRNGTFNYKPYLFPAR